MVTVAISRRWLEAASEIPHRHTDSLLDYKPADGQPICLRPNTEPSWEIVPVERNLKEPLWFTQLLPNTR